MDLNAEAPAEEVAPVEPSTAAPTFESAAVHPKASENATPASDAATPIPTPAAAPAAASAAGAAPTPVAKADEVHLKVNGEAAMNGVPEGGAKPPEGAERDGAGGSHSDMNGQAGAGAGADEGKADEGAKTEGAAAEGEGKEEEEEEIPIPIPPGADEEEEEEISRRRAREAERRRRRRKQKKNKKGEEKGTDSALENGTAAGTTASSAKPGGVPATDADGTGGEDENEGLSLDPSLGPVEIEYVSVKPEVDGEGFEEFLQIFDKFNTSEVKPEDEVKEEAEEEGEKKKGEEDEDSDSDEEGKEKGLSNKEKKLRRRMKIAELKQICARPDVVEVWDSTAQDPRLLVYLKAYRNTVPVPRHWSQKRKFLQGKRGIEKPPWQLPDFIAATGIEKLRQAYQEKEDGKKLKSKQRDKMQPKMGKMDIDYQVLHDAFFKYQTKPKLTYLGDVYYEGKEFEMKERNFKPGQLSEELRAALGMEEDLSPPPWLVNMQRYGPPPSYPELKIPGLNTGIPPGAQFGYHPGGWGKPPVDEFGRPLYGDVFGTRREEEGEIFEEEEPMEKSKHWGDLEEEEEEEEEEEDEEEEEEEDEEGLGEQELNAGMASIDSLSTTPAGMETPDVIDLRKTQRKEAEPADRPLYTVLEEREERAAPGVLLGTSHTYVLPGEKGKAVPAPAAGSSAAAAAAQAGLQRDQKKSDIVDISLRPEELEGLDDAALAAKFKAARDAERALAAEEREDFSDMVADREKKRKKKQQEKEKGSKKQKDFKF